jgi:hypothetical protein
MIENNIRIPVPDMIPRKKAELESLATALWDLLPIISPSTR